MGLGRRKSLRVAESCAHVGSAQVRAWAVQSWPSTQPRPGFPGDCSRHAHAPHPATCERAGLYIIFLWARHAQQHSVDDCSSACIFCAIYRDSRCIIGIYVPIGADTRGYKRHFQASQRANRYYTSESRWFGK
eukprot:40094-Prymnesium_polylepis.1